MNLESLYQEIILDHYKHPRGRGLLEPFEAEVHHVNPTCGDELTVRVQLDGDTVVDVSYDGQGCSISQASASVLYEQLVGESVTTGLATTDAFLPYLAVYADGAKSKITEPMVVAGGVSFKGVQNLTLESSWIFGFAEDVDRDGKEKDFHNSLMGGFGVRFQVLPTLELATGYSHDWTYYNDNARLESDGDLPTHYLSAGVGFQATPRLKVNGGAMWGVGEDRHGISKASGARQKMSSNLMSFGLGLEWSPAI